MALLDRLRPGAKGSQEPTTTTEVQTTDSAAKTSHAPVTDAEALEKNIDDAEPDRDAQVGVQEIEAITLGWNKKWLAALLIKYVEP